MADEGHAKMIVLVWLPSARSSCVGDKEGPGTSGFCLCYFFIVG